MNPGVRRCAVVLNGALDAVPRVPLQCEGCNAGLSQGGDDCLTTNADLIAKIVDGATSLVDSACVRSKEKIGDNKELLRESTCR